MQQIFYRNENVSLALTGVGQLVGRSSTVAVQLPVRACAWVAGSVPSLGTCVRQTMAVCLSHRCFSPSRPLSLKKSINE